MLRRVARALRHLLTAVGVTAVVLVPASLFISARLDSAWPVPGASVYLGETTIRVTRWGASDVVMDYRVEWGSASWNQETAVDLLRDQLPGHIHGVADLARWRLNIPLWLIAIPCLAWPATSFILDRRRHKRGFPVVQSEVRDQKSEVSPQSEAPKVRSNEAQGASPG